jgi:muramoyltetrapeptide carboxypeptidase
MLKPRALRPGDRLAMVAPASPFERSDFDAGVAELARLGFEPVFDDSVFAREGYLAGDATLRAKAFLRAWRDPAIAGLVAVRGGYGSVQILPYLDRDTMRATPKVFVGYSDLTSVLTYLTVTCGVSAFHGPMLDRRLSRGGEGYDRRSLLRALTSTDPPGELAPPGLVVVSPGVAEGPLYGGTLAQVAASLGTPYAFRPPGPYVLFLEDVGERPYRLDRLLTQLRLSGALDAVTGVVGGEFPDCDEPGGPSGPATMAALLRDVPGPVVFGFPSGHTAAPFVTLPLGVRVRLIADGRPRLVVEEAGVA